MAHGDRREEQWSAEQLELKVMHPCGAVRPVWPNWDCNALEKGHEGMHCNARQAGTQVIRTYWGG